MKKWAFGLSVAGLLFSGYLSAVKFFSSTCAFGESCPYFFGYPACYFGFGFFVLLTLVSGLLFFGVPEAKNWVKSGAILSGLGILYAVRIVIVEFRNAPFPDFDRYFFGVPTCAMGLVFYAILFVLFVRMCGGSSSPLERPTENSVVTS